VFRRQLLQLMHIHDNIPIHLLWIIASITEFKLLQHAYEGRGGGGSCSRRRLARKCSVKRGDVGLANSVDNQMFQRILLDLCAYERIVVIRMQTRQ